MREIAARLARADDITLMKWRVVRLAEVSAPGRWNLARRVAMRRMMVRWFLFATRRVAVPYLDFARQARVVAARQPM